MSERRAKRRGKIIKKDRKKGEAAKDTIQIIINSLLKGIRQRRPVSPLFSISLGGLWNATLFDASSSLNQKTSEEDEEGVRVSVCVRYIYIYL